MAAAAWRDDRGVVLAHYRHVQTSKTSSSSRRAVQCGHFWLRKRLNFAKTSASAGRRGTTAGLKPS